MRARGISQVELVVVLVVLAALAVAAWRLEVHGETVGYDRAAKEIAVRDNEQLRRVQGELEALRKDAAVRHRQHELEVAAIDTEGQRKIREIEHGKDQFVSDIVAGRIRLFDPNASAACRGEPAAGTAAAATGVDHGAGGGGLSEQATLFLLGEAARADKVVVKLTACQRELLADRKACNPP